MKCFLEVRGLWKKLSHQNTIKMPRLTIAEKNFFNPWATQILMYIVFISVQKPSSSGTSCNVNYRLRWSGRPCIRYSEFFDVLWFELQNCLKDIHTYIKVFEISRDLPSHSKKLWFNGQNHLVLPRLLGQLKVWLLTLSYEVTKTTTELWNH